MTSYSQALVLSAVVVLAQSLAIPQSAEPSAAQNSPASSPTPAASPSPIATDSTQLEAISSPPPYFPLEAAIKGILEGKVVVQLHISETGIVDSTDIISGDPLLAKAAADAMFQWKFKPFIKDGKPVRVSRKVPYELVLAVKSERPCAAVEAAIAVNEVNPQRGYVSPEITAGKRIHGVDPVYPIGASSRHIQGDVMLQAWVDNEGRVVQLKALCGPKELIPSSLDAVRQWRFSRFLDHGVPSEVVTMVKVQFRM